MSKESSSESPDNAGTLPKKAAHPNLKGGSRKGRPNKVTQQVKDAIAEAAEALGGVSRLVAWCQEEPRNDAAFWTQIYPKLLPVQIAGEGKNGEVVIEIVRYGQGQAT